MITDTDLEFLKRQVGYAPGATPEQRERWHIIMSLFALHKKVDQLMGESDADQAT